MLRFVCLTAAATPLLAWSSDSRQEKGYGYGNRAQGGKYQDNYNQYPKYNNGDDMRGYDVPDWHLQSNGKVSVPAFDNVFGDQPSGTMTYSTTKTDALGGFSDDTAVIVIDFDFPSGTTPDNKQYEGRQEKCYLPDTDQGREALRLYLEAFNLNKMFTLVQKEVGHYFVESNVEIKTHMGRGPDGWPDAHYFSRLVNELIQKHVISPNYVDSYQGQLMSADTPELQDGRNGQDYHASTTAEQQQSPRQVGSGSYTTRNQEYGDSRRRNRGYGEYAYNRGDTAYNADSYSRGNYQRERRRQMSQQRQQQARSVNNGYVNQQTSNGYNSGDQGYNGGYSSDNKGSVSHFIDQYGYIDIYPAGRGVLNVYFEFPGRNGKRLKKTAYLPNNAQGMEALRLYKRAIEQNKMVSSDKGRVHFDIEIKTNTSGGKSENGWPDPHYFQRLVKQMMDKGVVDSGYTQRKEGQIMMGTYNKGEDEEYEGNSDSETTQTVTESVEQEEDHTPEPEQEQAQQEEDKDDL